MPSFTLDMQTAERLDQFTDERDATISQLVRYALDSYAALDAPATRGREHSVRLDERNARKLQRLAKRAGVSKSKALALLIGMALEDLEVIAAPTAPSSQSSAIPGARAYKTWARLLMQCAHEAPAGAGAGSGKRRQVLIGAVIDELLWRTQPADPQALRAQVLALLPELSRRGLLTLRASDFPAIFPEQLLADSAVSNPRGDGAGMWHCIELS